MPASCQSPNDQMTLAAAAACCIMTRYECMGSSWQHFDVRARTRSGSAANLDLCYLYEAVSAEARRNYTANLPRGDATQQMGGL